MIQIILRVPELCRIFAPIFLINAIKFNRLDVLEEVANRAYFYPKRALKDKSSMDIPQAITDQQMHAVLATIPSMVTVQGAAMHEMIKILKGY